MKNEIFLVKTLSGTFKAAHPTDLEMSKHIAIGEVYKFAFSKPRNYKFHKKFFALIKLVFDNQEQYTNIDNLRTDLIIEAGFSIEKSNYITGEVTQQAASMSFAAMDEVEFSNLFNKMLDTVSRVYGWDGTDLEEAIAEFM